MFGRAGATELQEPKAKYITFRMESWFSRTKTKEKRETRLHGTAVGKPKKRAKTRSGRTAKKRRHSRYLVRVRKTTSVKQWLRTYACRCFSARQGSPGLGSGQSKKLSKGLAKGLVFIYTAYPFRYSGLRGTKPFILKRLAPRSFRVPSE